MTRRPAPAALLPLLTILAAPAAAQEAPGAAAAAPVPASAEAAPAEGEVVVTHAINNFAEPKYGPDAEHLDYVNPDAPVGGEYSMAWQGTFDSFNPYTVRGRSGLFASVGHESMMTATADEIGTLYCFLCETVSYPESRAWAEFTLRPEVRFSDGRPMTASDVAFTVELLREQSLPEFRVRIPEMIEGVEVVDERTIRYDFVDDAPFRERLEFVGGLPVFSEEWFAETGYRLDESNLTPILGSGAYVLDDYDVNQRIVYRRNPDYWGADLWLNVGRNNYETMRVEYFADSNAAFEGFKVGIYTFQRENTSRTWATGYDFPKVEDGTIVREEVPDGTIAPTQSYIMNLRRPQFQDPQVREAIQLLFNFEWTNEALFYDLYQRVNSFWENTDLAATGAPTPEEAAILQPLVDEGLLDASILTDEAVMAPVSGTRQLDRANLRRANALLTEAGWEVGSDGLRQKDGQTLRVEIIEDNPSLDRIHNPFVESLKAAGIDARLTRVDPAQMTDRTRNHDFDMFVGHFPMGYEPAGELLQFFGSDTADVSVRNAMGLQSEAVDRLIGVVQAAGTQEELTPAVRALDRVLRAERFVITQWYNPAIWVAYYDFYRHPEDLPPLSPGYTDFWWADQSAFEALDAAGAF